jgi:hypothetical protein
MMDVFHALVAAAVLFAVVSSLLIRTPWSFSSLNGGDDDRIVHLMD